MSTIRDKIDRLSAITGYTVNPYEKSALIILENEINDIVEDNQAKKDVLRTLDGQLEASKAELRIQKDQYERFLGEIHDDVDKSKQKSNILKQYIATVESSDDFAINKLKSDCDNHVKEFWQKLKPIHDRATALRDELVALRDLQTKCDELRQQAD